MTRFSIAQAYDVIKAKGAYKRFNNLWSLLIFSSFIQPATLIIKWEKFKTEAFN